ncbi:hypothetical protein [Pseudomonas congelans]|uniref:hypothetical protein n=1 Tax=Pseudomonas congelans TaxID=200452 RepID=UPI003F5CE0A6
MLDTHDQPVPQGVIGQLHIGGAGVTRGYLNLPKTDAERFIDSPFVAGAPACTAVAIWYASGQTATLSSSVAMTIR